MDYEKIYNEAKQKAIEGKDFEEIFPDLTEEEKIRHIVTNAGMMDEDKEKLKKWIDAHTPVKATQEEIDALTNVCQWVSLPNKEEIKVLRGLLERLK